MAAQEIQPRSFVSVLRDRVSESERGEARREERAGTERADPRENSHARLKQTPVPKARDATSESDDDVDATTADRLVILFRPRRRIAVVVRRGCCMLLR